MYPFPFELSKCSQNAAEVLKKMVWSLEYLNRLCLKRCKSKYYDIKRVHIAPLSWPLSRIIQIIPGQDSRVRVVKLKTRGGILTRPVTKLCLLL